MQKLISVALSFAFVFQVLALGSSDGGLIVGKLTAKNETADGKNINFEVLSPGEDKARKYHVVFDQKLKKPDPKILEVVRSAKVGETVELEWIKTGHGPAAKSFKVLPKSQK
ncbi:MAG: hypothetical protein ACKO9Z_00845 [Planctomycetota bacterium]